MFRHTTREVPVDEHHKQRLLEKVTVGEKEDDCWSWNASVNDHGIFRGWVSDGGPYERSAVATGAPVVRRSLQKRERANLHLDRVDLLVSDRGRPRPIRIAMVQPLHLTPDVRRLRSVREPRRGISALWRRNYHG